MANLRADNLTGTGGRNAIDGSVYFSGEEDQLQSATSTDFAFGTGAYTLEFWVKSGRPSGENGLFGSFTSSAYGIGIWHNGANLYFEERQNGYSGSNPRVTYSSFAWNKWNHLAISRDSTSGTMRAFVNGAQVGTVTSNLRDITATSETTVGHNNAAGNNAIAYISNLRLNNTQLYTAAFTPPTEKLKPIDGTVLLCCQDSDNPLQEATGKTITGAGSVDINETEYVTNGTFTDGYSPAWTAWGNTTTAQNGGIFLERTSTLTGVYQQLPTASMPAGQYKLRGQISNKTGPGGALIRLSSASQGNGTNFFGAYASPATSEVIEHTFTYNGSSNLYMNLMIGNNTGSADFSNISFRQVYTADDAPKVLPSVGVDEGVTFEGDTKVNSQQYMYFPTGDTTQRGRGRAVIFSGYVTPSGTVNEIVYFDIATSGTSLRFGDLGISQGATGGAAASETRAVYAGGWTSPGRDITYVTIATEGNSIDFGADRNGSGEAGYAPGCGNRTRGIFISSKAHPAYYGNTDFVTIATTGTCTDFGDVTDNRYGGAASASPTRAVYSGGVQGATSPGTNYISYCTIATTGSWANFGDLGNGSGGHRYTNGSSSDTRAIVYGGNYPGDGNMIQYITIASVGDAIDFGDAIKTGTHRGGFSNSIRGGAAGGFVSPGDHNTIEYVNIATTGNGIDWGDLTSTRSYNQGTTSDSHGGL